MSSAQLLNEKVNKIRHNLRPVQMKRGSLIFGVNLLKHSVATFQSEVGMNPGTKVHHLMRGIHPLLS